MGKTRKGGEHTRIDPKMYRQKLRVYPNSMEEILKRGETRKRLSTVLKELELKKSVNAKVGLLPETIHYPEVSISPVKAKQGNRSYGVNFRDQSPTENYLTPLYERTVPAKAGRKTRKRRRKSHRRRR